MELELTDNEVEPCFLCGETLPQPPEEMDHKEYYWIFGFVDGIQTAMRGEGYAMCGKHKALIRKGLIDRGINWGKPETTSKNILKQ